MLDHEMYAYYVNFHNLCFSLGTILSCAREQYFGPGILGTGKGNLVIDEQSTIFNTFLFYLWY